MLRDHILSVIGRLGVYAKELKEVQASLLKDRLVLLYTDPKKKSGHLFDRISNSVLEKDDGSASFISQIDCKRPILLFEDIECGTLFGWNLKNMNDVSSVVWACDTECFYVADIDADYLVSYKKHVGFILSGDTRSSGVRRQKRNALLECDGKADKTFPVLFYKINGGETEKFVPGSPVRISDDDFLRDVFEQIAAIDGQSRGDSFKNEQGLNIAIYESENSETPLAWGQVLIYCIPDYYCIESCLGDPGDLGE